MKTIKKLFIHYLIGIFIANVAVFFWILSDYILNGYWLYPETNNLLYVTLLSGVFFGISNFAYFQFKK
jgi:hypothetical protein